MSDLFGLDSVSAHDKELALLTTVYENTLLPVIESILRDAEIPYLLKERGSGGVMKVVMGFSMMGTDVFVKREDLEVATALITPPEGDEAAGETEEESEA